MRGNPSAEDLAVADFIKAFSVLLKKRFPNDPAKATAILSQFQAAHERFLDSLSLDSIERLAVSFQAAGLTSVKR